MFFHNEGYSTACGHGTIALVTWAVETGRVAVAPGARSVDVTVDVPSGRLACTARLDADGQVEAVRFRNVPSFVLARDVTVGVGDGPLTLDVGVRRRVLRHRRVPLRSASASKPADSARSSSPCSASCARRSSARLDVVHPIEPDLRGIYGVIFWEPLGRAARASAT